MPSEQDEKKKVFCKWIFYHAFEKKRVCSSPLSVTLLNDGDQLSNPGVYSRPGSQMIQIKERSKEVQRKWNIIAEASNQHTAHFEILQMKTHSFTLRTV